MSLSDSVIAVPLVAAVVSAVTALLVAMLTAALTRRRERESDWRRLKFERYQELVLAMSGIVEGRSTPEAQRRFADVTNSLQLFAPERVLSSLREFQIYNVPGNNNKSRKQHDDLVGRLFLAVRKDIHPELSRGAVANFAFGLFDAPPESP